MKNNLYLWLCLLAMMISLNSCELIGDILEIGIWIGIILVVLVVAIILWIVRKIRGR